MRHVGVLSVCETGTCKPLRCFSRLADADNQYKHAEASKLTMRRAECGILQALRFIPMWKRIVP